MEKKKNSVHNYYITCGCTAMYSDPIEKCPACGKANPELTTGGADTQPAPRKEP